MMGKRRQRFSRSKFRLVQTLAGIRSAFRRPKNPKRVIRVKRPGIGHYLDEMVEGICPRPDDGCTGCCLERECQKQPYRFSKDMCETIVSLYTYGKPGDSVIFTLTEMDADYYDSLEDWAGWEE